MIFRRGIVLKVLGVCAALFAACTGAQAAYARSLDDKEKAALGATIDDFDTAMRGKVYDRVAATVPPKVLSAVGTKIGADAEKMRSIMAEFLKEMMSKVAIESFAMDRAGMELKELGTGTPYALIPTQTVVSLGEKGRFLEKTYTLGLLDDGKWYLVRIGDISQLTILKEVYPEFTSVEFPKGSMEVLKK